MESLNMAMTKVHTENDYVQFRVSKRLAPTERLKMRVRDTHSLHPNARLKTTFSNLELQKKFA